MWRGRSGRYSFFFRSITTKLSTVRFVGATTTTKLGWPNDQTNDQTADYEATELRLVTGSDDRAAIEPGAGRPNCDRCQGCCRESQFIRPLLILGILGAFVDSDRRCALAPSFEFLETIAPAGGDALLRRGACAVQAR